MVRGLGPPNHLLNLTKILKYGYLHEISPGLRETFFFKNKKKTAKPKLTLTDEFSPVAPAPKGSTL